MNSSNLYRIHTDTKRLQAIKEIEFSDHNFKERYDIQEWLESSPEILGEDLLIIAKEKTCFAGTNERPDLIALDKDGNIVVIELKRDDSGADVQWQAIKYASYWSRFNNAEIVDVFSDYLLSNKNDYDEEGIQDKAEQEILEFIDRDSLEAINSQQRIILVSHRFSREAVSAVKWLIDEYNVNIKCIQLIPYYDADNKVYSLLSNVLLPVEGIEDLLIKAGSLSKKVQVTKGPVKKDDEITKYFETIKTNMGDRLSNRNLPSKTSRWAGIGRGFRYYHFWYKESPWNNWGMSFRIWLYDDTMEEEFNNKFYIYFDINISKYLAKGGTEEELALIKDKLLKCNVSGFEFSEEDEDDDSLLLYKIFNNDSFSENTRKGIEDSLVELIEFIKPIIDEIKQ